MKGYDKKKICLLYKEYVATESGEVFGQLIEELEPIIDIVLTKYGKFSRHFVDARQEMRMKLWEYFRDSERLKKFYDIPVTYLFFVIRAYMVKIFDTLVRTYEDDKSTVSIFRGDKELAMKEGLKDGLITEKQCILDTLTEDFFLKVSKKIERSNKFIGSLPEVQEMVIDKYKKKVEFDLERLIWE